MFDFDGTLAELNIDFPYMRRAILNLIAGEGVPSDGFAHLHILEMIDAAAGEVGKLRPGGRAAFHRQAHEIIRSIELDAAGRGRLLPGTISLLQRLRRDGRKSAVVTRNCRSAVIELFPEIGDFCDLVLARDDVPLVKPDTDHLIRSLRALETKPQDSAMVGDHPMDMRMGKSTGTWTIGVLSGHSLEDELRQAGADVVLENAICLLALLS